MSKQSVSSTHCKKLSICRVCLISASDIYSDTPLQIKTNVIALYYKHSQDTTGFSNISQVWQSTCSNTLVQLF